jgi:hypothetical protein
MKHPYIGRNSSNVHKYFLTMKNSDLTDNADDLLMRLTRIYRKISCARRISPDSQMCQLWVDPTVEILVGSDELDTLEYEFGIAFNGDTAMELYNMTLAEASVFIGQMVKEQNAGDHDPDKFISTMSPAFAKRVLLTLWKDREELRAAIKLAVAEIEMSDLK